jgi:hypothetical protein
MGSEALVKFLVNGESAKGKARLETDTLQLRGADVRVSIPFKAMRNVRSSGGVLRFESPEGRVEVELGAAAPKWADKIVHPPSRLAKLGVKADWRVSVLGIGDDDFVAELEGAAALVSIGRTVKDCDAIFFGATAASQLGRLMALKKSLKSNGALWVVRPKGRAEISESAVMAAGKTAGLVDVKVVSFSPTHTAEKFVIPLKDR